MESSNVGGGGDPSGGEGTVATRRPSKIALERISSSVAHGTTASGSLGHGEMVVVEREEGYDHVFTPNAERQLLPNNLPSLTTNNLPPVPPKLCNIPLVLVLPSSFTEHDCGVGYPACNNGRVIILTSTSTSVLPPGANITSHNDSSNSSFWHNNGRHIDDYSHRSLPPPPLSSLDTIITFFTNPDSSSSLNTGGINGNHYKDMFDENLDPDRLTKRLEDGWIVDNEEKAAKLETFKLSETASEVEGVDWEGGGGLQTQEVGAIVYPPPNALHVSISLHRFVESKEELVLQVTLLFEHFSEEQFTCESAIEEASDVGRFPTSDIHTYAKVLEHEPNAITR
ncbi:hypothetical protein K435DRAFT_812665 [Dendrothele bispora CBS 962.96]|uniref:Uncharacterized protein n=1 Tax=Dendrothele bispora (strain CBS 962.96) TaxID=1314807 RepID=A0A4S8KNH5_DENBC|nr:hypothetical protein K435DRAFT_812665 [Dendrothele bispora CBS 962.96]